MFLAFLLPIAAPVLPTVKANPFTKKAVIAWLKTKDPNETYEWRFPSQCLWAQYGKELGFGTAEELSPYYKVKVGFRNKNSEPFGMVGQSQPHTFGAALIRLQRYQWWRFWV